MRNSTQLDGWEIIDNSFITRGPDPTEMFRVEITRLTVAIEITEFFGDYSVIVNDGNCLRTSPRDLTKSQANEWLTSYGAPKLNAIQSKLP